MKVLIIDDESSKRLSVVLMLQEAALKDIDEIHEIHPGAFEQERVDNYDAFLLDHDMEPSGPEIAKLIKDKNPDAILVGYSMSWTAEEAGEYCLFGVADSSEGILSLVERILFSFCPEQYAKRVLDIHLLYRTQDLHKILDLVVPEARRQDVIRLAFGDIFAEDLEFWKDELQEGIDAGEEILREVYNAIWG